MRGPRDSSLASTMQTRESEIVLVHKKAKRKIMFGQVFNVMRRLAAVAAAIQYVSISMSATWWALQVLSGASNPTETLRVFQSSLIGGYLGDSLISESPLVQNVLRGDTTPRNYALYLESETQTSVDNCSTMPLFDSKIYSYKFLSNGYSTMVSKTKYNTTTLDELELVLLVVDCTFSQLEAGDPSEVRIYNLVRRKSDPNDLRLVTVSLSVQEYEIKEHHKRGPALVGMLTLFNEQQQRAAVLHDCADIPISTVT
ncbi:unnamed protein product [Phytophthora fragariaefolia]|uniref:Unnamed protein product n=1 Tax=Phytophthora fragariaefolia TaxID=1490495 RepID=A0A9W6XQQ9_9STRA|nr:unnamed protein product [Phytophthora fragariaefolia]